MIMLKSETIIGHENVTKFINDNAIKKDDILIITHHNYYTIYFYADSEVEYKKPGFWS